MKFTLLLTENIYLYKCIRACVYVCVCILKIKETSESIQDNVGNGRGIGTIDDSCEHRFIPKNKLNYVNLTSFADTIRAYCNNITMTFREI